MHACLQVSELVTEILQYVDTKRDGNELALVAQTCSTLYEPAMNVLWHTLPDLSPVMKCLPQDCWYEVDVPNSDEGIVRTLYLRRIPTSSEWGMVFRTARRVRSIYFKFDALRWLANRRVRWRVSFEAMHALSAYCISKGWHEDSTRSFLPNLRHLRWNYDRHEGLAFTYVPYLVTDKLRGLYISCFRTPGSPVAAKNAQMVMNMFRRRCPQLETIVLLFYPWNEDTLPMWKTAHDEISSMVPELPHLRVFLPTLPLSSDCLLSLAHKQHLQRTSIVLPSDGANDLFARVRPDSLFPALREMHVHYSTPFDVCSRLLDYIQSTTLSKFDAGCTAPIVTAAHMRTFFQRLSRHTSMRDLRLISCPRRFVEFEQADFLTNGFFILPSTVEPLLSLHSLVEVYIEPNMVVDLDDACVKAMAKAWPHIQKLTLHSNLFMGHRPRITLGGLLPLAEHCRYLEDLQLTVDMILPSEEVQMKAEEVRKPECRLKGFAPYYYHEVNMEHAGQMAKVLVDLFPELRYFQPSPGLSTLREDSERWNIIQGQWREFSGLVR